MVQGSEQVTQAESGSRASSGSTVSRRARLVWVACSLLGGLALTQGCARVAPYERETLARRDMELSGKAALRAGEEHAQAYREGSSGGGDAKGGGCGCN